MKKYIILSSLFFGFYQNNYAQAGKPDSSFGTNGIMEVFVEYYTSTVIQSDGKVVVVGSGFGSFAVDRYNPDGNPDNSFSEDGKQNVEFPFGFGADVARSVAIQNDHKIVVAGSTIDGFAVARLNTDGTLDSTFSDDGIQVTQFGSFDNALSVAIQTDEKIVVAGTSNGALAIVRYNSDGSPDSTFSDDGKQTTESGDGNFRSDISSVCLQADGKIVVVSTSHGASFSNQNFVITRYNTDGTPDSTFSKDGKQITDFSSGSSDVAYSGVIQSDGKIVVAGLSNAGNKNFGFAVVRYNSDGSPDSAFSEDGKQITHFASGDASATSVAIQSNGKIIVAGYADTGGDSETDFALSRYNTDGSLDTSFAENGKQVTEATSGRDQVSDIAISENKLYAVGSGVNNSAGIIARFFLEDEDTSPNVTLSIPYNIIKYSSPARIKLNATATDEDGTISKVRFYNGSTFLHTETVFPYGFLWVNVPVGNYTLTAKAIDNDGNVATSNTINVAVVDENVPPVVSIVSPVDDATYPGPATIHLIAKAKDPNDRISKVEFYNGTTLLVTEHYYPYSFTWRNVQPGNYTLTAKAFDDKGLSATSDPVAVTVAGTELYATVLSSKPSSLSNKTDLNSFPGVKLSPNPAGNILQVYTNGLQLNKPCTISIISASGVVVKTVHTTSKQILQTDVSSLRPGAYTLKVLSGDKISYTQFVKL